MTGRREAAQILVMLAWVRQQLKKVEERAKADIDIVFAEEKLAGSVAGADGKSTVVGYTQKVQPKPTLQITDETAFIAWVAERWPTEIIASIRPSFLESLKQGAAGIGGAIVDYQGEVCQHAELADPDPYTRTYLVKGADEALHPVLSSWSLSDLVKVIEEDVDGD